MIIKTYCARMDHGGCGLRVQVENGKIVKVEGDPDSPLNRGSICAKGIAQVERLNHPDRLLHPLKRTGERGEGKWERISWEEAHGHYPRARLPYAPGDSCHDNLRLLPGAGL
jgi:anaerobic selenocysteine-containing dehydrogenase